MRALPLISLLSWVFSSLFLASCVPDFDADESVVSVPRIVAIQADPPEAQPGEFVTYSALVAGPDGTHAAADIDWAFCVALKPLAELGPVSPACVRGDWDALSAMGVGSSAGGTIPPMACSYFGPEPPATSDGQGGRPTDPDLTGGYKQPVRAALMIDEEQRGVSFFEQRIHCGLVGANQAESAEFRRRYRRNANPEIESVELTHEDGRSELVGDGVPARVAPGELVELVVRWPDCPSEPGCGDEVCLSDETATSCPEDCSPRAKTCAGAEEYLTFRLDGREFELRREAIRVSWLATTPGLDEARTGVEADDASPETRNRFLAPLTTGAATIWIAIRDDRGGVGFRVVELDIAP